MDIKDFEPEDFVKDSYLPGKAKRSAFKFDTNPSKFCVITIER